MTKLDEALDAYLISVTGHHSDAYWDEVNSKIAEDQKRNMELNERFKPTKRLMEQEFTI